MSEWSAGELRLPVVDLPLSATESVEAAVSFLVQQLVESGKVRPEHAAGIVRSILKRESQGSTGIGQGIAVPHSKSNFVDDAVGVVGVLAQGMNWPGSIDGRPVYEVRLLVAPAMKARDCMRALQAVAAVHR
jgi:mannitol/fructose-specific phosphotransferase system IIA component (Ntr-type)